MITPSVYASNARCALFESRGTYQCLSSQLLSEEISGGEQAAVGRDGMQVAF